MFVAAAILTRLLSPVGLTWLAALSPAPGAQEICRVELQPHDAPVVWVAAAAALRDSLHDGPAVDRDCRQVVIHASRERPSVEVVTADGRHGVRSLADARDVQATVAALIVTVDADAAPATAPRAPESTAVATLSATHDAPAVAAAGDAAGWHLQIVAGGAARWSLPSTESLLIEFGAGVARPRWELGLYGALAPTTAAIGTRAPVDFVSTSEVALGGAWRPALGRSGAALIVGARAGLIRFVEGAGANDQMMMMGGGTGDGTDPTGEVKPRVDNLDGLAPTATAFVGAAFGGRSFARFRPQLWYQWAAATRLGGANASAGIRSVGLSIGVESHLP